MSTNRGRQINASIGAGRRFRWLMLVAAIAPWSVQAQSKPPIVEHELGLPIQSAAANSFKLWSEKELLDQLAALKHKVDPQDVFLVPEAAESWNAANRATLGPRWVQAPIRPQQDIQKFVELRTENQQGVAPPGVTEQIAIFDYPITDAQMEITIRVRLDQAQSNIGIVYTASVPRPLAAGELLRPERAGFVVLFRDKVVRGRLQESRLVIDSEQKLADRGGSQFSVRTSEERVIAYRDGEEILNEPAESPAGRYTGIIVIGPQPGAASFDDYRIDEDSETAPARAVPGSAIAYSGANVWRNPTYFDQRLLEVQGQPRPQVLQAPLAHGLFWADALLAPVSMMVHPPWQCLPPPASDEEIGPNCHVIPWLNP